jgi:glycosyltransferase involved in cell wall biosynthesis
MYIGRLDPKKGIENLLQAFGQFSEHEATLDIYGSGDSAYAAGLVSLGHSLGLDGRVRFHGHVDGAAKRSAFHTADVCVIPSHSENFGNVVAEALAHGVPVVASRGSPWAEVEKHGCGVWVDNTPEALAKAISAMRDRDLASMGEKGRMWMAEELRWSLIANRMCAAYSGLIGGC